MRILFNIISIIILITIIFLAFINSNSVVDFALWHGNQVNTVIYHSGLINIILAFFVAGLLAGIMWSMAFYFPVQKKLKEYQRQLEKTSVQSNEDSSKVEVLEAKIQVLEQALQSALEKNN